jgi:DNA-binding IclR family transcriptional regulator
MGNRPVVLDPYLYLLGTTYAQQIDLMRPCDRMLVRLAEETRETAQISMTEDNKYAVAMMREASTRFASRRRVHS